MPWCSMLMFEARIRADLWAATLPGAEFGRNSLCEAAALAGCLCAGAAGGCCSGEWRAGAYFVAGRPSTCVLQSPIVF
jgi:hypothetical protein